MVRSEDKPVYITQNHPYDILHSDPPELGLLSHHCRTLYLVNKKRNLYGKHCKICNDVTALMTQGLTVLNGNCFVHPLFNKMK